MKSLIYSILLALAFASCRADNPEPEEQLTCDITTVSTECFVCIHGERKPFGKVCVKVGAIVRVMMDAWDSKGAHISYRKNEETQGEFYTLESVDEIFDCMRLCYQNTIKEPR